jgi:predicted DNA-binding protein
MKNKTNTRVTINIPTMNHKKLKMFAGLYGKSMSEMVVELVERGLEQYEEYSFNHEPNATTRKSLENIRKRKGLKKASTVEELFNELAK